MFVKRREDRVWSDRALTGLLVSTVMATVLSVLDGVVRVWALDTRGSAGFGQLYVYWVSDFRYLFVQGMYVAALIFVGAKFFESRSLLTLGFDRADAKNIKVKGPDEDNVVWIGRRYGSALEAEAVAEVAARKLEEDREPS